MAATWGRPGSGNEWDLAVDLANRLADGGGLPVIPSPVLLDAREVLHADLAAEGWRFEGADITYTVPRVVAVGGPLVFGLTAAGGAAARRRARREAEALAAPQWRPLGALRIFATDRRLLVWYAGSWASVWYHAIREFRPDFEAARLDLTFDDDPPYHLAGAWVPLLTVIMTAALARDRGVSEMGDALSGPVSG